MGEEELFLCRCNALKEFITFSYLFKLRTWPSLSPTKESEPNSAYWCVTSSDMKRV